MTEHRAALIRAARTAGPMDLHTSLVAALRVLDKLPELVLAAKDQHGLTWQQIADQTGLSIPTCHHVAKRQRRCTIAVALKMILWLADLTGRT